jgi:N-acetylglucosamine-6-phosphate deacetylase
MPHPNRHSRARGSLPGLALAPALALSFWAASAARVESLPADRTAPPEGVRERTPSIQAFTNARIMIGPGRTIERGTLVVRDGVVAAVGASVTPPPDAAIHDLGGKTAYPGFIDAYAEIGVARGEFAAASGRGAAYWNRFVLPQRRAAEEFTPDAEAAKKLRGQGFVVAITAPSWGVLKGRSAAVSLGDGSPSSLIVKGDAALHVSFAPPSGDGADEEGSAEYPTSPMGAYTLVRQALYDADWYAQARAAWAKNPGLPRPEVSAALEALLPYRGGASPVVVDAPTERDALRADRLGKEFGLNVVVRGSGREYRRLDAIRATGRAILLPVNFPKPPAVDTPEDALNAPLEALMHWDIAPENPERLARAGIAFALTTDGLDDPAVFLERVRTAVARGLRREDALAALTTTPARLYGLDGKMGTLEPGKAANLLVADGDVFKKGTKIREVWIDGIRYPVRPEPDVDARGTWIAGFAPAKVAPTDTMRLLLGGESDSLSGSMKARHEAKLAAASLLGTRLFLRFAGDSLGIPGVTRLSAAVTADRMLGDGTWPDGTPVHWWAVRVAGYVPPPDTAKAESARAASFPILYPLTEFGRKAPPAAPRAVAFRGATVWTCGPAGVIENGTVVVERGRIAAVGEKVSIPKDAVIVDARGRHLTPGIIDCHSHTATDGWVNEAGQSVTAEVRIGDFVDPDRPTIYRLLAGGVTAAHVLHGSANTIGGQCQLIKLRWGSDGEAMKFQGAPPTIKFALGENVKQSNWGDRFTTRYPQTRMGVEQILRDEFSAARDYRRAWAEWSRAKRGIPPRRDLELDAIAEILDGRRFIHCHSYRQDEILMMMRVCDDFGVKGVIFQHVLEGYKVADEMAKRGHGASTFSDWWAYKMEVYDAIPYNGALMHDAGVVVSFNSDSDELGRRLIQEAAKAVKYGGVRPEEALKFVTLNAAKQLRVDGRVGSIEEGKEADLALWSGPPLSSITRCEQTWVDGKKYFDREEDQAARSEMEAMRAALVQRALGGAGR